MCADGVSKLELVIKHPAELYLQTHHRFEKCTKE
jgi:hypothetical protein